MKSHFISGLIKKNRFPDIPTVLTPYLQTVGLPLTDPVPDAADELAGNIPIPNPHVDAGIDQIPEPSVAILQDQEVFNPQLLAQIQEPNTIIETTVATSPQPSSSLNSQPTHFEGESAQEAPHKESDSTLAELPHSKRSKNYSTSEVITAQQQTVAPTPAMEFIDPDWEAIMAEVRRPVQFRWPAKLDLMVNLGNLDPLPTIGSSSTQPENISLAPERDNSTLEVERQLRTEDSILRSTPSTKDPILDQVPSQASEGNLSFSPIRDVPSGSSNKLLSTLPEQTTQDPIRDESLSNSERQLASSKDGDLRNPIAPLVTSLEGVRVISSAGTSSDEHKEKEMSETPTELVNLSVPSPPEPSVNIELSEHTPAEPVSETPPIQNSPPVTRAEFELLQQKVAALEVTLNQTIDAMQWVRHVQRDMYNDHNAHMASLQKQLDDFIQGRTVRTPSTTAAASTILKDSSTEGEKRAEQEKVNADNKGKRKASEALGIEEELEEGEIHSEGLEIHEPYIPYYVENIPRSEDFDECEDTEFVDELAYDDDCLGAKRELVQNLEQQARVEADRRKRSDQREAQRKKRLENEIANEKGRKDVQYKSCPLWDKARRTMSMPESTEENDDEKVKKMVWKVENNSSDIHELYRKLDACITSIFVLVREHDWRVIITIGTDRLIVSTEFLSKRSLTELFVMKSKVIGDGSGRHVNELLRDQLIFYLEEIEVEAHTSPAMVKYFKAGILHHLSLDGESLSRAKLDYLTYIERKLRFKGWTTKVKSEAAELIYGYRLSIMALRGGDLNRIQRQYPKFNQPTQEGADEKDLEKWNLDYAHLPEMQITDLTIDAQVPEDLTEEDSEAITLTEPLRFKVTNITGMEMLSGSDLQLLSSDQIQELFVLLKKSTNRLDKVGLKDVHNALKRKRAQETELDTGRVKGNPKMIRVFGHSQYVFLKFSDINQVTSIGHLKMFLKGLDPPTNSLEQQAVDLLKARLEELSTSIENAKKAAEVKEKQDRTLKLKKRRN